MLTMHQQVGMPEQRIQWNATTAFITANESSIGAFKYYTRGRSQPVVSGSSLERPRASWLDELGLDVELSSNLVELRRVELREKFNEKIDSNRLKSLKTDWHVLVRRLIPIRRAKTL